MLRNSLVKSMIYGQLICSLLVNAAPGEAAESKTRPHIDLAFCIDTTGSMGSEIEVVKAKTKELVAKLGGGKPAPVIRVGLVAYRDRGDDYVTKVFPFSEDIDKVVKDISNLQAAGGGDGPESVNEGLHVAVNKLDWAADKHTTKVLFLIGDAGPHYYADDFNWKDECKKAINRGIQINSIGCNGLESYPPAEGIDVFKQIARLTDGKYDTLAYRQEVVTSGGRKETIVSSGGAMYKVKTGDEKSWRAGVAALSAKGMAEALPTATPTTAGVMGYGSPRGASYRSVSAARFAPVTAEAGTTSRADSNLSDILLEGARNAVSKSHPAH